MIKINYLPFKDYKKNYSKILPRVNINYIINLNFHKQIKKVVIVIWSGE